MARSHIFPRALVHEMKDGGPIVLGIERARRGSTYYQSGPWEPDILCQGCEAKLSKCDDYAVDWIRTVEDQATTLLDGRVWTIPNRKPALLVQFAAAVLWRAAVARRLVQSDLELGPWEPWLRAAVFGGSISQPRVFLARRRYVTNGQFHGPIISHPYRAPNWGRRAYSFEIAILLWGVKLDNRSGAESLFDGPFCINDKETVTILNLGGC